MAVKADGTLWAWGHNGYGQLGDGTTTNQTSPMQIEGAYTSVAAGSYHTLALLTDGTLWAWGANSQGQLGTGGTGLIYVGSGYQSVAAAGDSSMAIKSDGTLWGWGLNTFGQIGNGNTASQNLPALVGSGYGFVVPGDHHTVALKTDGSLWAWGDNVNGQLGFGYGTVTRELVPTQVGSMTDWVSVGAGNSHTLAVKGDGTLQAWGGNTYGQLGDGTTMSRTVPVQIP
jgi:alpha-tubulin suppressor-like RCC1 family protein